MPVILGGHQALAFCRHDGNVVCQRVAADEDAAGMYAGLAHGTFEGFGKLDGFGNQWIGGMFLCFQLGIFLVGFLKGDFRGFRHHLCQAVGFRKV